MSRTLNGLLADTLIESIHATTPPTRHSRGRARSRHVSSMRAAFGWALVAAVALILLAMVSSTGA